MVWVGIAATEEWEGWEECTEGTGDLAMEECMGEECTEWAWLGCSKTQI